MNDFMSKVIRYLGKSSNIDVIIAFHLAKHRLIKHKLIFKRGRNIDNILYMHCIFNTF